MYFSAKPAPSSNLTITDVTTTSFKVSWIKGDGGGYEQTFHVNVRYAVVSYQYRPTNLFSRMLKTVSDFMNPPPTPNSFMFISGMLTSYFRHRSIYDLSNIL